jgi:hypothetical protein
MGWVVEAGWLECHPPCPCWTNEIRVCHPSHPQLSSGHSGNQDCKQSVLLFHRLKNIKQGCHTNRMRVILCLNIWSLLGLTPLCSWTCFVSCMVKLIYKHFAAWLSPPSRSNGSGGNFVVIRFKLLAEVTYQKLFPQFRIYSCQVLTISHWNWMKAVCLKHW